MHARHALLLLAMVAVPLPAQSRLGPPEKRPKLQAGADTNDAGAYFAHASRMLREDPAEAAAAFYWAARLDPSSADALDGRRAAVLMRKPALLKLYMEGGRRARTNRELRALDSLQMRAFRLDPLYYRKYDHAMLMEYYRNALRQDYPTASQADIDLVIRDYLNDRSHYMRGWVAYAEGRLPDALVNYELAMRTAKNDGFLLSERARVMALQGHYPKAADEFALAIAEYQKLEDDSEEEVRFYSSKALLEHSRGVIYARMKQPDSAKAALGRAITEDLSYFAAHLELGWLALAEHDTATAASEFGLAAELAPDEPWVHFQQGHILSASGQHAAAIAPLRRAIELEPAFALPHFTLAQALDRTGDAAGAREEYQRFLAMAPRREVQRRATATERIAALRP